MKTPSSLRNGLLLWCCTALASLSWTTWGATLTNRYSFTADVSDSVGGRNGTLQGGATIAGGQAVLANPPPRTSGDALSQYVALPPNLITGYTAITMEAWVTPTHDDVTGGAFWSRIWDFGNSDGLNGIPGFMWLRSGNNTVGVRGDIVSPAAGDTISSATTLLDSQENHVVWTSDGSTLKGRIYINGVLAGLNDSVDITPASIGNTTNDWLGRSQFAGDRLLDGSINEFRIYNGALNQLEVAASFASGPDTPSVNYGTVTNITLQIPATIVIGAFQTAQVLADASSLATKGIDIHDQLGVTYVSGNTNVLAVDANGSATGVAGGTTTLAARLGSLSSTQTVSVVSLPTTLIHRYSFATDASDSVGTANGALQGGATISGGQVLLDGIPGSWVDLPAGLINPTNLPNNAVTFESWATFSPVNGPWTRLFDFGNISAANGANYIFFAPNNATNNGNSRLAVSDANPGFNGEEGFLANTVVGQTNIHIVAVFNPNPSRKFLGLYLNGTLAASITTTKTLSSINNAFSFLGRSLYSGDSWLAGSIDEFRIYNGELDRFQIAASDRGGPGSVNFDIGSFVSFVLNAGAPTMPLDGVRQAACFINFSVATNINLVGDTNLTLSSSDTNVLVIDNAGVVQSRALGSATLPAVYKYVSGASTSFYTNAQALTVVTPPATLVHRYSFTSDANDSVGTANGTLQGGATLSGGQVVLNGTNGYVDLPDGIISVLTNNATFETWMTDNGSGVWARIWDFGSAPGQPNLFLDRQSGGNPNPRFDWSTGNINSSATLTNGAQTHIVVLYNDIDNSSQMYMNGALVATGPTSSLPLSSLIDTNNWLGRSQYADPFLNGSIDEFRIYSGLLTAAKIRADFAAGPNQLAVVGPLLAASLSGNNLTVSWPTNDSAGFGLESSGALGSGASWLPVTNTVSQSGLNFQVTVPVGGVEGFFRLRR